MPTPRRRTRLATGAFLLALLALPFALGGCVSASKKKSAAANTSTLVAPKHAEIGRVLSHDARNATAVIEFVPQFRSVAPLAGTKLISRKLDTLAPTGRLVAAPYQNHRTLGAYVVSGAPGVDDEVVIDPESALAETKSTEAAPPKPKGKPLVILPAAPEGPRPRSGGRR